MMSCKNKIEFIALKKQRETGIYDRDNELKNKKYLYESVLVADFPENQKEIKSLLLDYHKKSIDSVFIDQDYSTFSTTFYIKNTTTSYFIENADDPGGFSSEILIDYYDEYGIAEVVTNRVNNTNELKTKITFANKSKKEN